MSVLLNPVAWLLAVALLMVCSAKRHEWPLRTLASARVLTTWPVLLVLGVLVAANVVARIAIGIVAPGDFNGEIIAARSDAASGLFYSADLPRDRAALESAPADAVASTVEAWLPSWLATRARDQKGVGIVGQGHPPTILAVIVPLIRLAGTPGAFLIVAMGSVAAAWCASRSLMGALAPDASARWQVFAGLALIGWQPTLAAIRDGQLSVVIGAMAIAGWSFLRARRDGGAGSFVGAATALKFYPGLLLFAAPRSRRFVIAAVVTVLLAVAVSVLAFGAEQWGAYRQAVNDVGLGHARSSLNLSLVARRNQVLPPTAAFVVWAAGGALLVALSVWRSRAQAEAGGIDLSFARVACLAIVLSPTAWAHYLFLAAQPLAVLLRSAIAGHRAGLAAAAVGLALLLGLPVAERSGIWPSVQTGGPLNAIFSPTTVVLALWALLMIEPPDRRAGTTA
jgi:hypothetical protein